MNKIRFHALIILMTLAAYVLEMMMPKIPQVGNAQLLLVHAVFFSVAMSLSFPGMLVLAFVNGMLWDCLTMAPPISRAIDLMVGDGALPPGASGMGIDLPLGFSALLFALFGAFCQGVRPIFRRGRWELPVLLIGISVFMMQILEALAYSLFRLRFDFSMDLFMKISTQSLLAMSVAPLLIFVVHKCARWSNYLIVPGTPMRFGYGR